MKTTHPRFVPPHCPNPDCRHHRDVTGWSFRRHGTYRRKAAPRTIRRFLCNACGRCFSTQTFDPTYFLKRPKLLPAVLLHLLECSALRQMARTLGVAPSTVQRQASRLGRHCLLFNELHGPKGAPREPLVLDGLTTFELSQYWPCDLNLVVGSTTQFLYGFSEAERRRSGRMTKRQRKKRERLEALHGRPDPKATEESVRELLDDLIPRGASVLLWSDEHQAYPRALKHLPGRRIEHRRVSSKEPRTHANPLHPVNFADLLLRHCSANLKRETIAASKRRQGAIERLAAWQLWRNWMKGLSEKEPRKPTPAMLLGLARRKLKVRDVLARRIFATRLRLTRRLRRYHERRVPTRQLPRCTVHELTLAF